MQFHILTILAQINRGLLAVVFVLSNLFHVGPCCCASLSCCTPQDKESSCAVKTAQGCCCCQQSSDDELSVSTCCCSKTSQQSSTRCQGTCHCSEIPVAEGIVATPQRIQKKQVEKTWLPCLDLHADVSKSITSEELRVEQEFPIDPCAHNLRQAILCVWRN